MGILALFIKTSVSRRNCLHVANVAEFIATESGAGQERLANLLFSYLYCHLVEKLLLK